MKEKTQASMILLRDGFSLSFVSSGLDLDGKTLDFKLTLKPVELCLKHAGMIKLWNIMKDFLKIPYFSRKNPLSFLQNRIISIMQTTKNSEKTHENNQNSEKKSQKNNIFDKNNHRNNEELQGFEKVLLEDIKKEKDQKGSLEESQYLDRDFKKYQLKDQKNTEIYAENEKITRTAKKILYNELSTLREKARKKLLKEKALNIKSNLKRLGFFLLIDYKEIQFKLERNMKKSPIIFKFDIAAGKISGALNQPQSEMNFLALNGVKVEFNKDLDYLFELLLKLV